MWYRDTPPSLEQTKGMPNLMTNYSFGGGGNIFLVDVRKSSSILWSLLFSHWSMSTFLFKSRYFLQNSLVTRRASVDAGQETKGTIPCLVSWRSSSIGSFPLSLADTIVLLSFQRVCPDRNRSKQKHDENTIYGPRGIWGGYILRSFISKGRYWEKTSWRRSPGWTHHLVARPGVGPRHRVVWATLAPFPSLFRFVAFLVG